MQQVSIAPHPQPPPQEEQQQQEEIISSIALLAKPRKRGRPPKYQRPANCTHEDRPEHSRGVCYKCTRNQGMKLQRSDMTVQREKAYKALEKAHHRSLFFECTDPIAFNGLFGLPPCLFEAWFSYIEPALNSQPTPKYQPNQRPSADYSILDSELKFLSKRPDLTNRERLALALFTARFNIPICSIAVLFDLQQDLVRSESQFVLDLIVKYRPEVYLPTIKQYHERQYCLKSIRICDSPRTRQIVQHDQIQPYGHALATVVRTFILVDQNSQVIGWETGLCSSFTDQQLWMQSQTRKWLENVGKQLLINIQIPFEIPSQIPRPPHQHDQQYSISISHQISDDHQFEQTHQQQEQQHQEESEEEEEEEIELEIEYTSKTFDDQTRANFSALVQAFSESDDSETIDIEIESRI